MENRRDIKDFILNIEDIFPVNEWKINQVDIWPILRIKLYFLLISTIETSINEQKPKAKLVPKKEHSNSFISRVKANRNTRKLLAKINLNKLKKANFLFGTADTQRADYQCKSFNKFADPIMDFVNDKSIIIEHSEKYHYDVKNIYQNKRVFFLYDMIDYTLYSDKRVERKSKEMNFHLPEYDGFLSSLNLEKSISEKCNLFSRENLTILLHRFCDFEDCYTEIIKKVNPKIVFSVCYYSFPAMVLNYVANKHNIKTIEIQHGPQSEMHLAYAAWTKLPLNGFNTLPKIFWNWDKYSYKVVSKWAKNKQQHSCFIGGNPWVDFIKNDKFTERKIVLYSLQNLHFDYLFPPYLIEAIKTNKNFKWWLRLHPRQLEYLDEMISFLASKGIDQMVNIKEASSIPLPQILNQTKVHITNFSGCTLEAVNYNVPSIIIDERGIDAFKELINEKKAFYVSNATDFNEKLSLLLSNEIEQVNIEKNVTYKEICKDFL